MSVKKLLNKTKGDQVIWAVVMVLSLISLLAVYSSTGSLAYRSEKASSFFLLKQVMVLGLGLLIIYWVHNINYTKFAKVAVLLYFISIPLLLYTLLFGTSLNEGSRWIKLPVVNLTFQTSDLAKLALFMFLARVLSMKQAVIKDFKKGFLPVLLPMLLTCAFIAPANLSTALMLGATCSIVFYIGRVQVKHLLLLGAVGIMGVTLLFVGSKVTGIGRAKTWEKRIMDFTDRSKKDPKQEDVYQVQQAKIAIANGGVTGRGPGNSLQRNFLPHPYSDFIYSIIIEEYGLLGGAALVFFYLLFLWRSILIFKRCPFAFGAFLAVGLSITLVFQAMLNMAVNVHLVPVTGLTLPMVSMGGSSIWFTSVAIGIILSVSKYVDEMEGGKKKAGKRKIEKQEKGVVTTDSAVDDAIDEEEEEENAEIASKIFVQTGKRGTAGGVIPAGA
ncbi:cell division protein FtsW [Flavipsychrobacter stenotrophus]|uniref:Probable peptidoglycan glycosyltransferase FtsW n=1 Tax=Flavipsychrobacter stenotrophus TaxID=2077091 RepID=A0A2S7SVM2_9BACT|nr:FtsW/RodA/SpoVE family cell cycle protein [Flavipsychrobacter stenotrophus]PQJ10970.1 cell division protein FtsW [Flavipsychrobacter stenotrophus]